MCMNNTILSKMLKSEMVSMQAPMWNQCLGKGVPCRLTYYIVSEHLSYPHH